MADKNERKEVNQQLSHLKKQYASILTEKKNRCDHKDAKGAIIDPLSKCTHIKNRDGWSQNAVVCQECGEIMELESVTPDEQRAIIRAIRNMVNLYKIMGDTTEEDFEKLVSILQFTDEMEAAFFPSYNEMVKRKSKGGKKPNSGNHRQARFGVASTQFNK